MTGAGGHVTVRGPDWLRIRGEWLETAATKAVFGAIRAGGYTARAVGGTVRNALLGIPITDIDIATDARPEEVMRLAAEAGLRSVPTGIAHGTVTVIAEGHPYEVTTLRRDVATDGRRAEVAFTSDWESDAQRRDFTINAIYCEPDGTIFDPLGGIADLDPPRIRFIGNASDRIREDYLRILRFFRFTATFSPGGVLDPEGLVASTEGRHGLARISGERIEAELRKLLASPHAVGVTRAMVDHHILLAAVGIEGRIDLLAKHASIEAVLTAAPDPILRLAALAAGTVSEARALDDRLKLPVRDRERLIAGAAAGEHVIASLDERGARTLFYRLGPVGYRDTLLLSWVRSRRPPTDAGLQHLASLAERWVAPQFPIAGADILALGVPSGRTVGAILAAVEAKWIEADFEPTREELLAHTRMATAEVQASRRR